MTIVRKSTLVAAAALCLGVGPAHAQALIKTFTPQNVTAAVMAAGATEISETTINDAQGATTAILFQANGLKHIAALEVCQVVAGGCLGLNLVTVWNDVANPDLAVLNEFNVRYSFAKAMSGPNTVALSRYAISDGGVTSAHVVENIKNHAGVAVGFLNFYRENAGSSTNVSLVSDVAAAAPPTGIAAFAPLLPANSMNDAAAEAPEKVPHAR